VRRLKPVD
jgi:hypothetical protein